MNLDKEFCHLVNVFKCEDADKAWDYLISYAYNNGWIENSNSITPDEFLFAYSQIGVEGDPQLEHMTISETELSKNADTTFKKISKSMILQAITSKNVYDAVKWLYDKTQPAPLEAITYWKNHTETNDWYITIDGYETQGTKEVLDDKTVEEVKARLDELVTERVGEPLTAQDVEPAEFDQYGGVIMNKSMKDSNDEDTFMVTDHLGNTVAVDGMEKAVETATAYRKARAEFQLSFFIWRKITEPDGYFAWREENIADYL